MPDDTAIAIKAQRWAEGVPFHDPMPGAFTLDDRHGRRIEKPRWMRIACARCGAQNLLPIAPNRLSSGESFAWDGNREAPTLTGTIACETSFGGCGWRGQLRAGEWIAAGA